VAGETAVTLLTGRVGGALASPSAPLVAKGPWLQILVDSEWLAKLESDLACLQQPDGVIIYIFVNLFCLFYLFLRRIEIPIKYNNFSQFFHFKGGRSQNILLV
jgi:hypothetical protein